ncbi:MAG: FAD-dependent oxidoreductase [Deltaproteobacteria bacterium]|nr:FAD-dependent oxidoreductase [Deltaproteobacteria bacterium]
MALSDKLKLQIPTRVATLEQALFPNGVPTRSESPAEPRSHVRPETDDPTPGIYQLGDPPCSRACPVGIDVKGYVTHIADGDFEGAEALIRRENPMASVCGQICSRPCERECSRNEQEGAPVPIRALKAFVCRFVSDQGIVPESARAPFNGKTVAIVGAGPAGLTAARDLARAGFHVQVFDRRKEAGGLLAKEVPDFRLPRRDLRQDIEAIEAIGVTFHYGQAIEDRASLQYLTDTFDAVCLATGAHRVLPTGLDFDEESPRRSDREQEAKANHRKHHESVIHALDLLGAERLETVLGSARRVAVVGSTPSALAAARSVARYGRSCTLLFAESMNQVAADPDDLLAAMAEGVDVRPQTLAEGLKQSFVGLTGLVIRPTSPKQQGTAPAWKAESPTSVMEADLVVTAGARTGTWQSGQLLDQMDITPMGTLAANPDTGATAHPKVFAAGEAATGPRGVVAAVASGRRVAVGIAAALLDGKNETSGTKTAPLSRPSWTRTGYAGFRFLAPQDSPGRTSLRVGPVTTGADPALDHAVVELEHLAVAAARTCLRCGRCEDCSSCSLHCPDGFVLDEQKTLVRMNKQERDHSEATKLLAWVDPMVCRGCGACEAVCPYHAARLSFGLQASISRIDATYCRGCGQCSAVCPTGAIQYPLTMRPNLTWAADAAPEQDGASSRPTEDRPDRSKADLLVIHCNGGVLVRPDLELADGVIERFVPCTASVNMATVLDAVRTKVDRVALIGCRSCRFPSDREDHPGCPAQDLADRASNLTQRFGMGRRVLYRESGPGRDLAAVVADLLTESSDRPEPDGTTTRIREVS